MAAVQKARLRRMHSPIRDMQNCVRDLAVVDLPQPSLSALLSRMSKLNNHLFSCTKSSTNLVQDAATYHEHGLLIADVSKLITATVPQLERLGHRLNLAGSANSVGTEEETVFWSLWGFISASCQAVAGRPVWTNAVEREMFPLPVLWYSAFHAFMVWLLPFSRTPAWQLMTEQHGLQSRNASLLLVLFQPADSVHNLSQAGREKVHSVLAAVPNNFIPLLCCILSEQFGSLPPIVPQPPPQVGRVATSSFSASIPANIYSVSVTQVFGMLASLLGFFYYHLRSIDKSSAETKLYDFLESPAVLQCLKAGLVMSGESSKDKASRETFQNSTECLNLLFIKDVGAQLCAAVKNEAWMDDQGLPLHPNPRTCRAALYTDLWVIHALSKHMEIGGFMEASRDIENCYFVQCSIVQRWFPAEALCSESALAGMARSMVGLAKQSSLDCLAVVTAQLERQGLSCHQQFNSGGNHGKHFNQQQHKSRPIRATSLLALAPRPTMSRLRCAVRLVMFHASHFDSLAQDIPASSLSCE